MNREKIANLNELTPVQQARKERFIANMQAKYKKGDQVKYDANAKFREIAEAMIAELNATESIPDQYDILKAYIKRWQEYARNKNRIPGHLGVRVDPMSMTRYINEVILKQSENQG